MNQRLRGIVNFFGLMLMVFFYAAGCAQYPVNQPLKQVDTEQGYSGIPMGISGNSETMLMYLTFSGGGTRAAGFSYGVLEELRKTEVLIDGNKRRFLD